MRRYQYLFILIFSLAVMAPLAAQPAFGVHIESGMSWLSNRSKFLYPPDPGLTDISYLPSWSLGVESRMHFDYDRIAFGVKGGYQLNSHKVHSEEERESFGWIYRNVSHIHRVHGLNANTYIWPYTIKIGKNRLTAEISAGVLFNIYREQFSSETRRSFFIEGEEQFTSYNAGYLEDRIQVNNHIDHLLRLGAGIIYSINKQNRTYNISLTYQHMFSDINKQDLNFSGPVFGELRSISLGVGILWNKKKKAEQDQLLNE